MWLKRHLASRGVPKERVQACMGVPSLQALAVETGVLTNSTRPDVQGNSGLPISMEAFESEEVEDHMQRADTAEELTLTLN